jgi:hypothetical protein
MEEALMIGKFIAAIIAGLIVTIVVGLLAWAAVSVWGAVLG